LSALNRTKDLVWIKKVVEVGDVVRYEMEESKGGRG